MNFNEYVCQLLFLYFLLPLIFEPSFAKGKLWLACDFVSIYILANKGSFISFDQLPQVWSETMNLSLKDLSAYKKRV